MAPKVEVEVGADISGLKDATEEAKTHIGAFGKGFDLPTGKLDAAVGAIKGVAKFTIDAGKAGKDAADAQAEFARQMDAAGAATAGWEEKTNAAIAASQKMGFTDDETRDALATLAGATGDADAAIAELARVQDLAAASNTDLTTTAKNYAEALGGSDVMLTRQFDALTQSGEAAASLDEALALSAGAAELWASTSEAQAVKVQTVMSEMMEMIGTKLIPLFGELKDALKPWLDLLLELVQIVWPLVQPVLALLLEALSFIIEKFGAIPEKIQGMMDKLAQLIQPIQDVIDKIKEIDLTPFGGADKIRDITPWSVGGGTPAGMSASARGAGGNAVPTIGSVTFNISGDPSVIEAKVTKALRAYTRRNGPGSVFQPGRG